MGVTFIPSSDIDIVRENITCEDIGAEGLAEVNNIKIPYTVCCYRNPVTCNDTALAINTRRSKGSDCTSGLVMTSNVTSSSLLTCETACRDQQFLQLAAHAIWNETTHSLHSNATFKGGVCKDLRVCNSKTECLTKAARCAACKNLTHRFYSAVLYELYL